MDIHRMGGEMLTTLKNIHRHLVNLRKVRTFKSVLYENVDDFLFHWKDHSIFVIFRHTFIAEKQHKKYRRLHHR